MTFDEKVEHAFAIAGALVPLVSAFASVINHIVRERQANNERVSPMLLGFGAAMNVGAVNIDKALQLARAVQAAREKKP